MQRKLIKLALISTFIVPQMNVWAVSDQSPVTSVKLIATSPTTGRIYSDLANSDHHYRSKAAFLDFMDDDIMNQSYINAQKQRLKTVGDLAFEQFLDSTPEGVALTKEISQSLKADVQATTTKNLLTKALEIKDSDDPNLYHQLIVVMEDLGFSRKQIKKTKFFRAFSTSINADAYTASVDGVGFELLSGLDDMTTRERLRGVFGHELGHVRAGHVMIGVVDSVIQVQLMKQLVDPNGTSDDDQIAHSIIDARSRIIKAAIKRFNLKDSDAEIFTRAVRAGENQMSASHLQSAEKLRFLQNYLDTKIAIYSEMEINASDLELLIEFRQQLEPGRKMQANASQIANLVENIMTNADSRNMESSADAYGDTIGRPSEDAMADAQFGGRKISAKLTIAQVNRIIKRVRAQVNLARRTSTRAEYFDIIGGAQSSDHPYSNPRILKQAAFDRSIDRIALSNPFLRLIVLRDQMKKEVGQRKIQIENVQASIDELVQMSAVKKLSTIRAQKKLTAVIAKLQKEIDDREARVQQVEAEVNDLLNDPKLMVENPRVTDLLDYRLAERQMATLTLETLKAGNDKDRDQMVAVIEQSLAAAAQDGLLQAAIRALQSEISTARPGQEKRLQAHKLLLSDVEFALTPQAGTKEILVARTQMSSQTHSPDRIALSLDPTRKNNSNTEWDQSAPHFKDERKKSPSHNVGACGDLFSR